MSNTPLVSVIIPTYKRSDYLLQTVESVLNQTYPSIEIIIVDDNGLGTNYQVETQAKLQQLIDENRITYIPHKVNKNGSAARNTGFASSKGAYIQYLDDDDELMPDKLRNQVLSLSITSENVGATYCNKLVIRKKGLTGTILKHPSNLKEEGQILESYLLDRNEFGTSQILFKREAIERLGGFDESFSRHQDVELMTRFFDNYSISFTQGEPLVKFDLSKDRSNFPNPDKDLRIKKQYLSTFEKLFKRHGIRDAVFHHFWFKCLQNALRHRNFKVAKLAYSECVDARSLSLSEYKVLAKRLVVGLLDIVI